MGPRHPNVPIFRMMAAALIAALATGGSWAPAAGPLRCDACRRDLTGNVVCTKRQAANATPHVCCKTGRSTCANGTDRDDSDQSPTKCPPCCGPQAHVPAPAGPLATVSFALDCVHAAPDARPAVVPLGVHESVFHPPRA